jgi:type IV pilus assembly protein PilQ
MLIAACAVAAISGGGLVLTASPAPEVIRLVGVSAQGTGRTAAVVIQATGPAAYAVSRPDPLTLLIDLRNATLGESATNVAPTGPIKGVSLEQATAIDGGSLARVRVALVGPVQYSVHSDRNVIRLDLDGQPVDKNSTAPAAFARPAAARAVTTTANAAATFIENVHTSNTRTSTTVVLSGNGRLNPASLTESDAPRRLVLDFPDVSSRAPAQVSVDSAFVKKVRVALNSHDPLVTRVVMEISPKTTYHVERAGADGRDLALVFEGAQPGAAVLVAPPTTRSPANDDDAPISLAQALSNGASLAPHDPIDALLGPNAAPLQNARVLPPTPSAARAATVAMTQTPSTGAVQAPSASSEPQPPVSTAGAGQSTPPLRPGQPTMSAPVPGSGATQYTGHPISFDFEDTDLRSVLRVFAQESGLNMIIDPTVQGRVNVLLTDVPWDQALDQILRANKLGYTVDGNIIRIAPLAVLADEQAQTQKLNEAKALAGELVVKTFPLSYAKADALAPLLVKSALSARGQIQTDLRTNTLIVMDLPDHLQTAGSLIATLDKPQPQVDVEARIVQTTRQFARALGVQWGLNGRATQAIGNTLPLTFPNNVSLGGAVGTQGAGTGGTIGPNDPRGGSAVTNQNTATVVNLPAAGATSAIGIALGSISGAFNLDVALSALENTGKGRILSTPRLTTQNNQPAEIAQGVQIPIQTVANNTVAVSFRDATLKLDVTPQITAANTVIMNIQVSNETPDFSNEVNGIPPINTQRAQTVVQVDDGATTVIGGIFVSQQQTTDDHTPALYRVPILKWLFQSSTANDSSNELLIFITPKILRG